MDWLSVQGEGVPGYASEVLEKMGWSDSPKNKRRVYSVMAGSTRDRAMLDAIMQVVLEPETTGPAVIKTELKGKLNLVHS